MSMDIFNGPIPGQSLTKALGSHPHDNPPQYADLNSALEHVFKALTTDPRQVTRLLLILKKDVPVEYLARTIIFTGFQKGMWTPDVGLMMLKSVMAMIISIAKIKGIKVTVFNPDKEQDAFLDKFLDLVEKPDEADAALPDEQKPSDMEFTGLLGGSL